ncbi:hypothetical protein ACH42_13835 [Endozoicomonas sp. (ex Bugula neritina AB1)]|nr:hypothetical protein ACH42_13835 [Endozoicomonas sp. (ex Bugula neritina AB1)]
MWVKAVILILFIAVVISLGSGFYFLLVGRSPSLLNSLKVRIGLTVLIMLVIVFAWLHGDIHSQAPWLYR